MIQCVDRKLKAADQLIYAEDDDMLHVAFIATNVNRSAEHYLNHQYTLYESFKTKNYRLLSTVLYLLHYFIQNINFRMLNFTSSVNILRLVAEPQSNYICTYKEYLSVRYCIVCIKAVNREDKRSRR